VIIRNVTKDELNWALAQTNRRFRNNLKFKRLEKIKGRARAGGEKWNVTLTVRNCYGRGGRYYPVSRRHVTAACWHAHGNFYDALPLRRNVEIITSKGGNYNTFERVKIRPGDYWLDWRGNGGTPISECCHCRGQYGRRL
jgi:hypothetical protein